MNDFLFDETPEQLLREVFVMDPGLKTFQIVTQQDVEPVLESNLLERNAAPKRKFNNKSGLTKVASIPNVIMLELREKGILQDPVAFKRWLNSPAAEPFRTRGGNV